MPCEARLVRQPGDRRAVALLDVLTDLADAWPAMQATMYRRLTAAPALSCSAVVSRLGVQLPATTTKPYIIAVSVEVMCEYVSMTQVYGGSVCVLRGVKLPVIGY